MMKMPVYIVLVVAFATLCAAAPRPECTKAPTEHCTCSDEKGGESVDILPNLARGAEVEVPINVLNALVPTCELCGRVYAKTFNLKRHRRTIHAVTKPLDTSPAMIPSDSAAFPYCYDMSDRPTPSDEYPSTIAYTPPLDVTANLENVKQRVSVERLHCFKEGDSLSELDDNMGCVVRLKGLNDSDKAALYLQILQNCGKVPSKALPPFKLQTTSAEPMTCTNDGMNHVEAVESPKEYTQIPTYTTMKHDFREPLEKKRPVKRHQLEKKKKPVKQSLLETNIKNNISKDQRRMYFSPKTGKPLLNKPPRRWKDM